MYDRDLNVDLLIFLLLLLLPPGCQAIERNSLTGARENALSQAVIALPGPFSMFHNQACMTDSKATSIGIGFRQPYSIPGYQESTLAIICPISSVVFGLGISQAAIGTYKELNLGLSIAKKLTSKLSAGLLFNYFNLNFPESGGQKGAIQINGGIRYQTAHQIALGLHLQNAAVTKIETFQYQLCFPLVIRGGASCHLSGSLLLTGELVCEIDSGTGFRCGTEYQLNTNFEIRAGISTKPFQHSVGFGYKWNFIQFDFALVHNEWLGYTPSLSFNFNLKK